MMKEPFKSYEIKQLKLFYKLFDGTIPDFKQFKKELFKYGYTDEVELVDLYRLYSNNFVDDGKFESIEVPYRGLPKLIKAIKTVIKDKNMAYDDMIALFNNTSILGSWFNVNKNSYYLPTPYIDVDPEGLEIYLDNSDWEEYFSGLDEDSLYYYNMANSYDSHYEEQDSDEFRYATGGQLPNELKDNLETLSKLVGDFTFIDTMDEEGALQDFLEKYFPDKLDDIQNDYLSELGYAMGKARSKSVEECYNDEVKFTDKGRAQIFIPWKELLLIVNSDPSIITLSELKNAEINGEIELSDCWYEGYPSTEEYKEVYEVLNRSIEKLIEDLEDDDKLKDAVGRVDRSKQIWSIIDSLGFKKEGSYFTKKTKNNIVYSIVEFNIDTGKVKLHVNYPPELSKSKWGNKNTEVIETPIEELSDWVNSLTLDRQAESFRRIFKKILSERKRSL